MFETFEAYLKTKMAISEDQFRKIRRMLILSTISKGQVLLHKGEVCKAGAFVTRGCLRSYVIDDKGKEHIIQFAPENWWISEQISMLRKEPSIFFIDALEDSQYIEIPQDFYTQFQEIVPESEDMFRQLNMNSFRALQKRMISHLSGTGEERYLEFIHTYPSLALRLPQKMIASYLGVTAESLSRIRKELANH